MSAVPNPSSGVEVRPVGNILRPRLDPWETPQPGGASNIPPLFIYLFIQNITVQAEFIAYFIQVLETKERERKREKQQQKTKINNVNQ